MIVSQRKSQYLESVLLLNEIILEYTQLFLLYFSEAYGILLNINCLLGETKPCLFMNTNAKNASSSLKLWFATVNNLNAHNAKGMSYKSYYRLMPLVQVCPTHHVAMRHLPCVVAEAVGLASKVGFPVLKGKPFHPLPSINNPFRLNTRQANKAFAMTLKTRTTSRVRLYMTICFPLRGSVP